MKKKFDSKKVLKTVLQLIVYSAVIYFIYDRLNGHLVELQDFTFANAKWLLVALGVYSLHSLINAHTWFKMMELSGEKVNVLEQMTVYLKSDVLRYIPGNVVGILARAIYNKEYKVSMAKSLWGWFFENVAYLVIGILIGSYAISILPIDPVYVYMVIGAAVVGGLFGILKIDWLEWVFNKIVVKRLPKEERGKNHTLNIDLTGRFVIILRYLLTWIVTAGTFIIVVYAVDGLRTTDLFLIASIYAMARSIGYLAIITPTGGGIRELVIIQLLSMVSGYTFAAATVIAIVTRVVFILAEFLTYEVYLVDNTGEGNSIELSKDLNKENKNFKSILIPHPGIPVVDKSNKYTIGNLIAKGKYIVYMDSEGQDRPEELPKFIEKLDEGYDLVMGWKQKRKDGFFYMLTSGFANWLTRTLTGVKVHDMNSGYKAMKASAARSVNLRGGNFRFLPAIFTARKYKVTEVPVKHEERTDGPGRFTFMSRLMGGLFDLPVTVLVSKMGDTPIYFWGKTAILMFVFSVLSFIGYGLLKVWPINEICLLRDLLLLLTPTFILSGILSIFFGISTEYSRVNERRSLSDFEIDNIIE
jgi:glycosyltransferase involved in cell wall biosynthesis